MTFQQTRLSQLLAPSFFSLHHAIKRKEAEEVWCKGGRGSTKSSFISIEIFLTLIADEKAHAYISRRYDNELGDSVYGQMQWACEKLNLSHEWRFVQKPMRAENVRTKQKIIFRGVDNPEKAKSINLGSGFIKAFWAEEIDQYGGMEEIRKIIQSVFRGEGSDQIAFFSYNPPKSARSWVNQEVKIPKPGRIIHHSDYRSVPTEWLGERFISEAEHLKETNNTAYRHEYLGEEVGTGLEVFNNVNIRVIPEDERMTFGDIDQGLDFGYAADPLSFERLYYYSNRRKLYIFDEISGIGISNRGLSERMTFDMKRALTTADNAEPKSIAELKNDYGLNIRSCTKGPGSIEHGIKWLSDLAEIVIDPVTAPLAAKEYINYALETNRQGDIISKYPDKNNHTLDATRYGLQDDIASKPRKKAGEVKPLPVMNRW